MDVKYALKRLFDTAGAARKAAKAYYACPGDPKADQLKKDYLKESKRRETDLDQLLTLLPRAFAYLESGGTSKQPESSGAPMTVPSINATRLASWKDRLDEQNSTPQILIAIGHGRVTGRLMVLTTEDLTNSELIVFMEGAIRQLKEAIV